MAYFFEKILRVVRVLSSEICTTIFVTVSASTDASSVRQPITRKCILNGHQQKAAWSKPTRLRCTTPCRLFIISPFEMKSQSNVAYFHGVSTFITFTALCALITGQTQYVSWSVCQEMHKGNATGLDDTFFGPTTTPAPGAAINCSRSDVSAKSAQVLQVVSVRAQKLSPRPSSFSLFQHES